MTINSSFEEFEAIESLYLEGTGKFHSKQRGFYYFDFPTGKKSVREVEGFSIHPNFVAAVHFGLWTSLFRKDYEQTMRKVLVNIFPYVTPKEKGRVRFDQTVCTLKNKQKLEKHLSKRVIAGIEAIQRGSTVYCENGQIIR